MKAILAERDRMEAELGPSWDYEKAVGYEIAVDERNETAYPCMTWPIMPDTRRRRGIEWLRKEQKRGRCAGWRIEEYSLAG